MYSPLLLTLQQIAATEHEKDVRHLAHLKKINAYQDRMERQVRIERLEERIREYNDEHK